MIKRLDKEILNPCILWEENKRKSKVIISSLVEYVQYDISVKIEAVGP